MNHKDKESSYYDRMNSTMSHKIKAIAPIVTKNKDKDASFLDFGSGLSLDIKDFVSEHGYQYEALDCDPYVQSELHKEKIVCYNIIDAIPSDKQYDIVYMSSVFHELLVYKSHLKIINIFNKIHKLLKPNGHLIIRDWAVESYSSYCNGFVTINSQHIDEIYTWYQAMLESGVLKQPINVIIDNLSQPFTQNLLDSLTNESLPKTMDIQGQFDDIVNLMYHCVWGIKSLQRESQENYVISPDSIGTYITRLGRFECVSSETDYDESYLKYLNKYFPKMSKLIHPTKQVLVFKKLDVDY